MKKLSILLVLLMLLSLVACTPTDDYNDDDYTITIKGLGQDIAITKAQIKALDAVTLDNLTAIDKFVEGTTDPIVYSAKGVYLDDIIAAYCQDIDFSYDNYSRIVVTSTDSYSVTVVQQYFMFDTKPLIAYQYNGNDITTNSSSGALRMVVDGSEQALWAKKLHTIQFFSEPVINEISTIAILGTFPQTNNAIDITTMFEGSIDANFVSCMIALDPIADGVVPFIAYRTDATGNLSSGKVVMNGTKAPYYFATNMQQGETVSNLFSLELPATLVINQDKLDTYLQYYDLTFKQYLINYSMYVDMYIHTIDNSTVIKSDKISIGANTTISHSISGGQLNITIDGTTFENVNKITKG